MTDIKHGDWTISFDPPPIPLTATEIRVRAEQQMRNRWATATRTPSRSRSSSPGCPYAEDLARIHEPGAVIRYEPDHKPLLTVPRVMAIIGVASGAVLGGGLAMHLPPVIWAGGAGFGYLAVWIWARVPHGIAQTVRREMRDYREARRPSARCSVVMAYGFGGWR